MPRLGGSWISAFFLVGLLIPFRNEGLAHLRWFLLASLVLFLVVQALGQTHVSRDAPEINSENLLVLSAPLVFIYGAAMFHTLLDQLNLPPVGYAWGGGGGICRNSVRAVFICAAHVQRRVANSPYSPLHIQQTARLMQTNEIMMSDIPGGVAWYGGVPVSGCRWMMSASFSSSMRSSQFRGCF